MFDLTTSAEHAIQRLLEAWWRAHESYSRAIATLNRDSESERKATSVEVSGVLPDGTKYAIKEYAASSEEAYRIAGATLLRLQQDRPAK
jgi:hypothetical protein